MGNVTEPISSDGFRIDAEGPKISNNSVPTDSPLSIFNPISIDLTLTEDVTSYEIQTVSAQGDPSGNSSQVSKVGTNINIQLTPPFTSADQITVSVSLTDVAGNINSGLNYTYTIGYLADYDNDGFIVIQQNQPLPMNVIALFPQFTTYDG